MAADELDALHNSVIESKRKFIAESSKSPTELPSDRLIFCNDCKGETNHLCKSDLVRHHLIGTDRYIGGFLYTIGYRLWMCAGCENCTLERYYTDETMEDENGIPSFTTEYFPKRGEYQLDSKRFMQLPSKLDGIYREVIQAFNDELGMLCAIGIRVLVEGICADQKVTGKNLEAKIDGLSGVLPKNIVINLHSLRFMGNEAAHEFSVPLQSDLRLAIEICEDLLNYLYELDYKASYLAGVRKGRKDISGEIV